MADQYPIYYGTQTVTLAELRRRFQPVMHPEFARRLFAWIASEGGTIGIGSGHRSAATQLRLWLSNPTRFARPGNSFHEEHKWASGITAYAAVDLVRIRPGNIHRSPTFAECESAKAYGLHVFIKNEPWHMQLIETRSASVWKRAGRPDPATIILPTGPVMPEPVQPTPPTPGEDIVAMLPTLRNGSSGEHVGILQSILNFHGADLIVDGQFGGKTENVVRFVQGREGLVVDGVVGPQTWARILKVR